MRTFQLAALVVTALASPGMEGDASKCPFHTQPSAQDLNRAQTVKHTGKVGGTNHAEIASKINAQLASEEGLALEQCEAFDHDELNELVRQMWCHKTHEFQRIYGSAVRGAAKKQDSRTLRFATLDEYEAAWAAEAASLKADGDAAMALKEAKCAEVLMMYSHHLTTDAKAAVRAKAAAAPTAAEDDVLSPQHPMIKMPKLPTFNASHLAHPAAGGTYGAAFSCLNGHNMTLGVESDHVFPHWPAEAHYFAKGHGAYPFWLGGTSAETGNGALEVWYSETKSSEKYYHATCAMKEAGTTANAPCYHLFNSAQPSPTSYLYTADESFCCLSNPGMSGDDDEVGAEKLAAPQSDFMDQMTYKGVRNWTGTFYSGPTKFYLETLPSTEAVTYFWYATDMNDRPVQQGEGGNGGSGIEIYHEYNTSSFEAVTLDASVFAVPEICKKATKTCTFP